MDCCDRFALWLAELTLDRVKGLETSAAPAEMIVRASCQRRRFDVTIRKQQEGCYCWNAREVTPKFAPPQLLNLPGDGVQHADPETAFWAAWGAIDQAVRGAALRSQHS